MANLTFRDLGERIREARDRRGATQEEVARAVNLDRTTINKIESGIRKVSALELADIAGFLGVRMASFFEAPSPAIVFHRSSQGLEVQDSKVEARLADLASDVEFVQRYAPALAAAEVQPLDRPERAADAERLARAARGMLDLEAAGPATDLASRFAKVALLVFSEDLGTDGADAAHVLLRRGGVALVNSSNKIGRRRLSAVHELGHHLIADEYTIDWRVADDTGTEALLDRFSRAFLLPSTDLSTRWVTLRESSDVHDAAVIIAGQYQVDMATLARRLAELDIADAAACDEVRQVRTKKADIIEHDLHIPVELGGITQPRAFQVAVLSLVRSETISQERALELLGGTLSAEDLPEPPLRSESAIWEHVQLSRAMKMSSPG